MNIFYFIFTVVLAYMLGSIPSAVWYGRAIYGIDVREHGSGNAGATNTLRVLGRTAGFIVLGIDFLKGLTAASMVIWYRQLIPGTAEYINYQMIFGALAVSGHVYPVFAGFKGGKGIATLTGVVTAIDYKLALLCFTAFFIVVYATRFISLGSMIAGMLSPIFAGWLHHWQQQTLVMFCALIAVLVIYTHRTNIRRLLNGNENKFSFNKKPSTQT